MRIIFEDQWLMAIDKPAGLSAESGGAKHPSAEKEAWAYYAGRHRHLRNPYLRAVHRLDRVSSGVLLFAKSKSALSRLMGQFERKETEKTYRAIVEKMPEPPAGALTDFLRRSDDGRSAVVENTAVPGAQEAVLSYQLLESGDFGADLEIFPKTGRFHQIRAQLAHAGWSIAGDILYGGSAFRENEIKLHAMTLRLRHPATNESLLLEAPLPADWRAPRPVHIS